MWCNEIVYIAIIYLRPEIFHRVKIGDETEVGLPCFAFVILEKPKSPPEKSRKVTTFNLRTDMRLLKYYYTLKYPTCIKQFQYGQCTATKN